MQETAPVGRDLALKIDCEGCEWDVLEQLPETHLTRFKTITGEFHLLANEAMHEQILRVMEKLKKHFRIVHTHGCNCRELWGIRNHDLHMPSTVPNVLSEVER